LVNPASVVSHGPSGVVPAIDFELGGNAKLNRGGVAWSIFDVAGGASRTRAVLLEANWAATNRPLKAGSSRQIVAGATS
jgi:hypothetical protein